MSPRERLPTGRPFKGHDFVTADVIAHLSKVNMGSVVRVLAAIQALHTNLGGPLEPLLELADVPLNAPAFDGTEYERVMATRRAAEAVAADPRVRHLSTQLHLGRFRHNATVD